MPNVVANLPEFVYGSQILSYVSRDDFRVGEPVLNGLAVIGGDLFEQLGTGFLIPEAFFGLNVENNGNPAFAKFIEAEGSEYAEPGSEGGLGVLKASHSIVPLLRKVF
jgi:hypothetical protein